LKTNSASGDQDSETLISTSGRFIGALSPSSLPPQKMVQVAS